MNIFVGNISFSCTEEALRGAFEAFGEVTSAKIIMSRETGRSRGFGFVEMADDATGQTAITELDGKELDGRPLKVNEARPREDHGHSPR